MYITHFKQIDSSCFGVVNKTSISLMVNCVPSTIVARSIDPQQEICIHPLRLGDASCYTMIPGVGIIVEVPLGMEVTWAEQ